MVTEKLLINDLFDCSQINSFNWNEHFIVFYFLIKDFFNYEDFNNITLALFDDML